MIIIDEEEVEEIVEPTASIQSINEIGDAKLSFSQEMYLDEVFADFEFATEAEYEDVADDERRRLQNN